MTLPIELKRLTPAARTELIYGAARSASELDLWRSALGRRATGAPASPVNSGSPIDLGALVQALLGEKPVVPTDATAPSSGTLNLGANQRFAGALQAAAERTGLPAAALASIVDAEAAKGADGSWNVVSRNGRSTAAGLGQFLSGTWVGEAERTGTHLHSLAAGRGWLDERGKVRGDARNELLALRFDPNTSIQATADFARGNLDALARCGVVIGDTVDDVARTAYLAHHLGASDALRFLRGGLNPERAATLLTAQVGAGSAARRIADAGDAASAHRAWVNDYIGRHLNLGKFTV